MSCAEGTIGQIVLAKTAFYNDISYPGGGGALKPSRLERYGVIHISRLNNPRAFAAMPKLLMVIFLTSCLLIGSSFAGGSEVNYKVGSGDKNWWTAYPSQHTDKGSQVKHPDWVLDALKEKPIIILVHSTNCKPCKAQMGYLKEVMKNYDGELNYFDIVADGTDIRSDEVLNAYDPTGPIDGIHYVPTTVILTLAKGSDGKVDIVWHSAEDATSKEWIDAYISDAINYYGQNSKNWTG
jgi:thiol-disulfide isomerase/thioredoxin